MTIIDKMELEKFLENPYLTEKGRLMIEKQIAERDIEQSRAVAVKKISERNVELAEMKIWEFEHYLDGTKKSRKDKRKFIRLLKKHK